MNHFPGAFMETEVRLLQTISGAVHWLPDPKCLRFVDQEALEFLRYIGYIEKASYGGYRLKANMWTVGRVR